MKDLMGLMKQAKDMQKKMESAQEMVADLTAIGRQAETMKSAMGDIQLPPGMKMPF